MESGADFRMRQARERPACFQILILYKIGGTHRRKGGNASLLEDLRHFPAVALAGPLGQQFFQRVFVRFPIGSCTKACIKGELGLANSLTQGVPFFVRATRDGYPGIFSRTAKAVVRSHEGIVVPVALWLGAVHDVVHPAFGHESGHSLKQRHVNILTLAGAFSSGERGADCGGGMNAAIRVAIRNPNLLWRAALIAGEGR